jgi:phosphatidylserine/phosphatidylglycerophosphate/cardiolipin synthase-like enzyme
VIAEDPALAAHFAEVFEADDAPWPDVRPADDAAPPALLVPTAGAAAGPTFDAGLVDVTPVFSPDDALSNGTVLGMVAAARSRVDVEMLFADARFGDAPNPFLDALVDAARRNVPVRLLLDGAADAGRNREVAQRLDALAAREGIPLEAKVDGGRRLLHAKAVVADDDLYVGSMNWGRASATRNREAGLILRAAPEAAAWARGVMERDWTPGPAAQEKRVPAPGLEVAIAVALSRWASASRRGRS